MAAPKPRRDFIDEFFNSTGPPRPAVNYFKYPTYPVPIKPAQKIQRGQKGLDYVAAHKESVNCELTKVSQNTALILAHNSDVFHSNSRE